MSFDVYESLVPHEWCDGVLRRILLDVRDYGLNVEVIRQWNSTQPQFPHLRSCSEIAMITNHIENRLRPTGERCEPQIVWHLPDHAPDDMKPWPHVDEPPAGKRYTTIIGVCFTDWGRNNGGLEIWIDNDESRDPECSDLWPGDVIVLSPDQKHSPGINRSHEIRAGLYLRWVEDAA